MKKIKEFDQKHPYLTIIIIFLIGSAIGITIQYLIDGTIIKNGIYPSIAIALASLFSTWLRKRKNS